MRVPALLPLLLCSAVAAPVLSGAVTYEHVRDPITDENRSYVVIPARAGDASVLLRCRSGNVQAIVSTPDVLIDSDPVQRSAAAPALTVRFDRSAARTLTDSDVMQLEGTTVDTGAVALRGSSAGDFVRRALSSTLLAVRTRDLADREHTYLFDLTGLRVAYAKIGACRTGR